MGAGVAMGLVACLAPGTALAVAWMQAPARVADYERSLMSAGLRRAKGKWKTAARTGAR